MELATLPSAIPALVIVVVEPDRAVLADIALGLREAGYLVATTSTWWEARAAAHLFQPALILVDTAIAGLGDAAGLPQLHRTAPHAPVVIMGEEARHLWQPLRAADYLDEPTNMRALLTVVHRQTGASQTA